MFYNIWNQLTRFWKEKKSNYVIIENLMDIFR